MSEQVAIPIDDLYAVERAIAAALCDGLTGKTIPNLERAHDKLNSAIDQRRKDKTCPK